MARTLNTPKFTGTGPQREDNPFDNDPTTAPVPPRFPATDKQIAFYTRLCSERGVNVQALVDAGKLDFSLISKHEMSAAIDAVLKTPKTVSPGSTSKPANNPITEDGMYRNPETGEIFKVQKAVHGSGKLYAKALVVVDPEPPAVVRFDYAPGMIYKIKPEWKMTLEEAKAFGALYGTCCVCGRTLTKEESIDAGIGPVCAGKF